MELIDRILDKCAAAGADMADVYILSCQTLSITVRGGEVETIKKATPGGMGIRFYKGGKMAFAHSTDVSEVSAESIVPKLAVMAQKTEADQFAALPGKQSYPGNLEILDPSYTEKPTDVKIDYLIGLESKALKVDPLVDKSNGVSYDESINTKKIGNSNGLRAQYDSTFYRVGVSVVATKDGEMFPGEGSLFACNFGDIPSQDFIVERFASRAARLVGGKPVEPGEYEIIFTPRAANSILYGLNYALNGDGAYKGSSFLSGKLGQKVAVDGLSLFDDAIMKRGLASRPSDDEGMASQKTTLIENGILHGFLYDMKTAAKAKARPTASSLREDYSSFPGISVSNFYIAPGKGKVGDVIAACKKGIIVEETQGWGLHSVTGQYSAGINGILVENGKRIRPVAGVTIAGSAEDILMGIGAICNDITYYDNINSPSLMVKRMTVGA